MATFRARWTCPFTGRDLYRDFTLARKADAFRDLPRPIPVEVKVVRLREYACKGDTRA